MWRVERIDRPAATADFVELDGGDAPERRSASLDDLVVVAEFKDKVYPGLVQTGRVERGGDKPFHTVINAENYHALEMLTYTHRHSVDAIYIDPPFPRKWSCCGVVCGHVEPDPSDVEAEPLAA